jgi:hypothetical protein
MSSIGSGRKGRPNTAKSSDSIEIAGDFSALISQYVQDNIAGAEYRLDVNCVSVEGENDWLDITETQAIPEGTRIPKGPVGIYRYTLTAVDKFRMNEICDRYVKADKGATINFLEASEAKIRR